VTLEWDSNVVTPGASYWSTAESLLRAQVGRPRLSNYDIQRVQARIVDANQYLSSSRDINRLPPGMQLRIPPWSKHLISSHRQVAAARQKLTQSDLNIMRAAEGSIELSGHTFDGDMVFPEGSIAGNLCLCNATFTGNVEITNVQVAGYCCLQNVRVAGQTILRDLTIGDDLAIDDAELSGDLILENVRADGSLSLQRLQVQLAIYIGANTKSEAIFLGGLRGAKEGLYITDVSTRSGILAHSAHVGGSVHVEASAIDGDFALAESDVGGQLVVSLGGTRNVVSLRGTTLNARSVLTASYTRLFDLTDVRARGQTELHLDNVGSHGALLMDGMIANGPTSWHLEGAFLSARRLQLAGGTLEVVASYVDLTNADFLGSTVLRASTRRIDSDSGRQDQITDARKHGRDRRSRGAACDSGQDGVAARSRGVLIASLQGANTTGLALSGVDLSDCRFGGSHALDELIIEDDVTWAVAPRANGRRYRTRRQVIAAERFWRATRGGIGWTQPPPIDDDLEPSLSAARIAALYRALRKGCEDRKNEPGAADFYYGEMEMRRLGADGLTERLLLAVYWLVSGYGLRAWRALASLIVVVMLGGLLIATWGVRSPSSSSNPIVAVSANAAPNAKPPTSPNHTEAAAGAPRAQSVSALLPSALTFSAESASAVLHDPSPLALTLAGQWCQVILRLAGPVLLGLAVLSLRGRVKR
jgi:hypothetical protein